MTVAAAARAPFTPHVQPHRHTRCVCWWLRTSARDSETFPGRDVRHRLSREAAPQTSAARRVTQRTGTTAVPTSGRKASASSPWSGDPASPLHSESLPPLPRTTLPNGANQHRTMAMNGPGPTAGAHGGAASAAFGLGPRLRPSVSWAADVFALCPRIHLTMKCIYFYNHVKYDEYFPMWGAGAS